MEYKVLVSSNKLKYFDEKNIPVLEEIGQYYVRIHSAADLPDENYYISILEPWVNVEIIFPRKFVGDVMQLCQEKRGVYKEIVYIQSSSEDDLFSRAILKYELPLSEVISDFFDRLKSVTHGYASVDYQFMDYREGDIVKLNVLINSKRIDALSIFTPRERAIQEGRRLVSKLKELIPRHQFRIIVQAAIGSKIIAREEITPYRKDVTKGLSGGDHRRKLKHLERQKEGKKRMKMLGSVNIPQEAFLSIFKRD